MPTTEMEEVSVRDIVDTDLFRNMLINIKNVVETVPDTYDTKWMIWISTTEQIFMKMPALSILYNYWCINSNLYNIIETIFRYVKTKYSPDLRSYQNILNLFETPGTSWWKARLQVFYHNVMVCCNEIVQLGIHQQFSKLSLTPTVPENNDNYFILCERNGRSGVKISRAVYAPTSLSMINFQSFSTDFNNIYNTSHLKSINRNDLIAYFNHELIDIFNFGRHWIIINCRKLFSDHTVVEDSKYIFHIYSLMFFRKQRVAPQFEFVKNLISLVATYLHCLMWKGTEELFACEEIFVSNALQHGEAMYVILTHINPIALFTALADETTFQHFKIIHFFANQCNSAWKPFDRKDLFLRFSALSKKYLLLIYFYMNPSELKILNTDHVDLVEEPFNCI